MAANFMTDSTNCSTTTDVMQYLTISNNSQTTATITTQDTGGTGNCIFIHSNTGGWTQHSAPPQHAHQAPQVDPRVLNRYLNASDLLEEFIRDLGDLDVKQGDVLDVPIELFINWLVCKAAEEDGHAPPDDIAKLPAPGDVGPVIPDRRCRCWGRYITERRRSAGVLFCDGEHQERWLARLTGGRVLEDRRAVARNHSGQRQHDHVQVVPRRQLVALAGVG